MATRKTEPTPKQTEVPETEVDAPEATAALPDTAPKFIEIAVPGGTARVSPAWADRWPDEAEATTKSKED